MTLARQIVSEVCRSHRNSDLRADNADILQAFDTALVEVVEDAQKEPRRIIAELKTELAHTQIAASKDHDALTRILHAIAITLGLETWEDLPQGSTDAVCESIERAVNARVLAAFVRGQRSARAAEGVDPDELPESATEGMSERERLIRRDQHRGGYLNPDAILYLLGVIDVIREDRNRLRSKFQSGAPEPLTRDKIREAVEQGYRKSNVGLLRESITDAVCQALSSGGAVPIDPALPYGTREAIRKQLQAIIRDTHTVGQEWGMPHIAEAAGLALRLLDGAALLDGEPLIGQGPRCQSKHGDQQCIHQAGHKGHHAEGNEVWSHE